MAGKKNIPYEFADHTADIKVRLYGQTLNEIFEHAVLAFADYVASGEKIVSRKGKVIKVQGTDTESLLYHFFDELIYLLDAEQFVAAKAEVLLRGNNLKAEVFGDSTKKYQLKHVKAATYAEMSIKKTSKGWEAVVVLDV